MNFALISICSGGFIACRLGWLNSLLIYHCWVSQASPNLRAILCSYVNTECVIKDKKKKKTPFKEFSLANLRRNKQNTVLPDAMQKLCSQLAMLCFNGSPQSSPKTPPPPPLLRPTSQPSPSSSRLFLLLATP